MSVVLTTYSFKYVRNMVFAFSLRLFVDLCGSKRVSREVVSAENEKAQDCGLNEEYRLVDRLQNGGLHQHTNLFRPDPEERKKMTSY